MISREAMLVVVCMLCVPASGYAQDPSSASRWMLEGDVRVRGDFVQDLPGGRDDLERARITARPWLRFMALPMIELSAGPRLSLGTDSNGDNDINFDNEQSDAVELDRAMLAWRPTDAITLSGGRMPLPLRFTPLTWDDDLRPIGVALDVRQGIGFDVIRGGAALGVVPYLGAFDDRLAMFAGQIGYGWREGAASGAELLFGTIYVEGENWEHLAPGMIRQNRPATPTPSATYREDFHVVNLQVAGHTELAGIPAALRLEAVRNMKALDGEDQGERVRAAVGDARRLQVGWAWQRIERDAVVGALNSDDWWFHSRAHGHSAWIETGVLPRTSLRASGFRERREDLAKHTTRLLLELTFRLGPE